MAEQVKIRHPELTTSDEDNSPPVKQVSLAAFETVWSKSGWELVEEPVATNADVSATPSSSPTPAATRTRTVTDSPQV